MLPGPQHSLDSFRQELAGAGGRVMPMSASWPSVALYFGERAQQVLRNVLLYTSHLILGLNKVLETGYVKLGLTAKRKWKLRRKEAFVGHFRIDHELEHQSSGECTERKRPVCRINRSQILCLMWLCDEERS
jgi:hypothetical protein